jgi:hypothetical protein
MVLKRFLPIVAGFAFGLAGCATKPTETVINVLITTPRVVSPPPSVQQQAKAQHVTSDQLYTIYSQHLIQGALPDQRFRGRLLHVTGIFEGVDRHRPGWTFLELATHDPGAFTYAILSPDAEDLLATLQPGTEVKLLCRGAGGVAGSPFVGECRGD